MVSTSSPSHFFVPNPGTLEHAGHSRAKADDITQTARKESRRVGKASMFSVQPT